MKFPQVLSFLFLGLFAVISQAQTIFLPYRWHFTTNDSMVFVDPQFNDSNWTMIDVPDWWEHQGFDGYDGTAWYRVHFAVEKRIHGDSLCVVLGKIDDADETYLNGVLIGGMGKFPPTPVTAYNKLRTYRIAASLLRRENVLAVRVDDTGGPGGIYSGPLGIYDEDDYRKEFNPPPGPKKSFHQLVTSNGLIAAVYDEQRGFVSRVLPHIFQAYDSSRFVEPFLLRIVPTLKSRPVKTFYDDNTHVIAVSYPNVEINYFAPFTTGEPVFYAVISGPPSEVRKCSFTYEKQKAHVVVDSADFKGPNNREEKYVLFSYTDSLHDGHEIITNAKRHLVANGGHLLADEISFMKKVFARCKIPRGITPAERALLEQSIAVLKMAQVSEREVFPHAGGQILASLPPGQWNIAWVRDGSYSILGLDRLGLFDEARRFLSFMMNAESSHYEHFVYKDGKDYGIGMPYRISVCRYFGIGKEESDFTQEGPNIELDGFGLYLIAVCDYVERSGDTAFFKNNYERLADEIGDVIIHSIDTNNVIRMDSGPWERHLPGKQFAYTTIACAAGLRDFAAVSARLGLGNPDKYRSAYERLVSGIRANFSVDGKLIKGNVEAKDPNKYDYFDGGTFEAFGFGLFQDKRFFQSQLKEYGPVLRVPGGVHGFSRINKGDWYEIAEWVLLDLRIASAMTRFGDRKDALKLINWVTDQAALNFNLIPELYDQNTSYYEGAVPMVGFGAGAYIVALSDVYGGR